MIPVAALTLEMMTLLGADTVTLAAAAWVMPLKKAFTPGSDPEIDDTWIADFDGSTPKACGAATRVPHTDAGTGQVFLSMPPPAGGYLWTTTGVTNLPQTIYGYALSSSSTTVEGGDLLGTQLQTPNVILSLEGGAGQSFQADEVRFTLIEPALQ